VRDIGVTFHGNLFDYLFQYSLFAMNGNGQNNIDNNNSIMAGLRLDFNILGIYKYSESDVEYSEEPNLGVGIAYAYKQNDATSTTPKAKLSMGTIDAGLKYKGFSIQVAGMVNRTHTGPSVTNWGYNAQVGYFLIPRHVELAAKAGGIIIKGAPDQYEYAGVLNYFVKGHSIKLQTDYTFTMNNRGQGLNDHRIRTQMQVVF